MNDVFQKWFNDVITDLVLFVYMLILEIGLLEWRNGCNTVIWFNSYYTDNDKFTNELIFNDFIIQLYRLTDEVC